MRTQQEIYKVISTLGGYRVTGPDGREYVFDSFSAAKKLLDKKEAERVDNNMNYTKDYPDEYPETYPDCEPIPNKVAQDPEEYYGGKRTVQDSLEALTYKFKEAEAKLKEMIERNEIGNTPNQFAKALKTSQAQKIQAEIDRIEAQIAKSTDEENKAKITTYVAGLHKALELIQA